MSGRPIKRTLRDPRDVIHLEQASKDRMVHRDVEDRILLPEAPWRSG